MQTPEVDSHSFVVKIWLEEVAQAGQSAEWRGHITHVPSGARQYIQNLNDIMQFVKPYLEKMGVKFKRSDRLRQYLKSLRLLLR